MHITKYETGATSHAINDLILFTENNRELAELRDRLYKTHEDFSKIYSEEIHELYEKSRSIYIKIFGEENSKHIININAKQRMEYLRYYINAFDDWKKENNI